MFEVGAGSLVEVEVDVVVVVVAVAVAVVVGAEPALGYAPHASLHLSGILSKGQWWWEWAEEGEAWELKGHPGKEGGQIWTALLFLCCARNRKHGHDGTVYCTVKNTTKYNLLYYRLCHKMKQNNVYIVY